MKKIGLVIFATLLPLGAYAASAQDPVRKVMDIAVARWVEDSPGGDYFDQPFLDRNYSKGFVAVYHEAEKFPAYDEGTTPFDYDVITASQDGCPIKDLKIATEAARQGVTTVDVSFRLWDCADSAAEKAKISQVKFDVIIENGRPVISDIHRFSEGKWDSLVSEMQETVKAGQQ